jgi:LmbE family N-acetylglucosaminyl deacetylase/glycosyltransferase involved in cell wall biosynthesis
MIPEELVVPYHATSLVGARVLLLAPHPDDETIGCGGSLALHQSHGDLVKVIVLTDGAFVGEVEVDREEYAALREQETSRAMSVLGVKDVEFWRLPDRGLVVEVGPVSRLVATLKAYQPTLLYIPSPQEAHPDHVATAQLAWAAIEEVGFPGRVCLYEVAMPIRPNILVDITAVVGEKGRAMACYQSQLMLHDYTSMILGLNRYRSYSLPGSATHAEAFWCLGPGEAATTSLRLIRWQMAARPEHPSAPESPLVSIIVRTRNRPQLLRECLKSIVAQTYRNLEVVLVNDGGEGVEQVMGEFSPLIRITPVINSRSLGRPGALNAGLRQAKGIFIAYLDDDDVYYFDHIETLVHFLRGGCYQVAYTDVCSVYQRMDLELGRYVTTETRLQYAKDFDPDSLLFGNYIPINAVMHTKKVLDAVGLFDEGMEVIEDWELWIRMSRSYRFGHLAKCTAEYRIRDDATNVTSSAERDSLFRTHEIKLFQKYAAERLEAVQRLFNSLKQTVFHMDSELQRVKSEAQGLLAQREGELSKRDEVIHSLEARLQAEVDRIDRITESLGWQLLQRFSSLRGRIITPQGSVREKVYEWIKSQVGPTMRKGA